MRSRSAADEVEEATSRELAAAKLAPAPPLSEGPACECAGEKSAREHLHTSLAGFTGCSPPPPPSQMYVVIVLMKFSLTASAFG